MWSGYRVTLIVLSIFLVLATSVQAQAVNAPPITLENMADASAVLGDIGRWLKNNMPYPPEVMARMSHRLSPPIFYWGLGWTLLKRRYNDL